MGPTATPLKIPLTAIPFRNVNGSGAEAGSVQPTVKRPIMRLQDDSEEEDLEDIEFLFSDDELDGTSGPPMKKSVSRSSSVGSDVARDVYVVVSPPPFSFPLTPVVLIQTKKRKKKTNRT
jgi:hypothetical protein